jgi:hypothetical protein
VAEREARERVAQAHDERSSAEELRAKAEKLAPGLSDGHTTQHRTDVPGAGAPRTGQPVRPDEQGGATRR